MSDIHTSFRADAHVYTRSTTPWILDGAGMPTGRLFRYLSGGGLKTFGRTVRQEEVRDKHLRFYVRVGIIAVLWLVFYFI